MTDLLCLYPENPESSRFKVICKRGEYSASRIAHAVEDCNAHVLNLNVTSEKLHESYDDDLVVDLRVEHRNAVSVIRSLERYGYAVIPIDVKIADDDLNDDTVEMSALERFLSI